jgi:hypothetical protein
MDRESVLAGDGPVILSHIREVITRHLSDTDMKHLAQASRTLLASHRRNENGSLRVSLPKSSTWRSHLECYGGPVPPGSIDPFDIHDTGSISTIHNTHILFAVHNNRLTELDTKLSALLISNGRTEILHELVDNNKLPLPSAGPLSLPLAQETDPADDPPLGSAVAQAAGAGHEHVIRWLIEDHFADDEDMQDRVAMFCGFGAIKNGAISTLEVWFPYRFASTSSLSG